MHVGSRREGKIGRERREEKGEGREREERKINSRLHSGLKGMYRAERTGKKTQLMKE